MLDAFMRLNDARQANVLDERESHIRQSSHAIEARLLFHLLDDVLDGIKLVLMEIERFNDQRIAFDQLRRSESTRNTRSLGMVAHQFRDAVNATMKGAAVT